jgi:hypothetical protein
MGRAWERGTLSTDIDASGMLEEYDKNEAEELTATVKAGTLRGDRPS